MFADGIDFCISGKFSPKPIDKTFFEFSSTFMAGPVPLKLAFGAGGSLGVDLGAKICVLSMKVKVRVRSRCKGQGEHEGKVKVLKVRVKVKVIKHESQGEGDFNVKRKRVKKV
jgi:hypothetical protein